MTAGTTASVLGQSSNYRVIYDVIDGQPIILIVGVGHRREFHRAVC
jgi:mRNA-degrading endonuclease RelE of RelBE toxin-antitoxin system